MSAANRATWHSDNETRSSPSTAKRRAGGLGVPPGVTGATSRSHATWIAHNATGSPAENGCWKTYDTSGGLSGTSPTMQRPTTRRVNESSVLSHANATPPPSSVSTGTSQAGAPPCVRSPRSQSSAHVYAHPASVTRSMA